VFCFEIAPGGFEVSPDGSLVSEPRLGNNGSSLRVSECRGVFTVLADSLRFLSGVATIVCGGTTFVCFGHDQSVLSE
jgi:hypothetical protein